MTLFLQVESKIKAEEDEIKAGEERKAIERGKKRKFRFFLTTVLNFPLFLCFLPLKRHDRIFSCPKISAKILKLEVETSYIPKMCSVVAPWEGGLGGLIPPPKCQKSAKIVKETFHKLVTFRLKKYLKIPPPPHSFRIFQSWHRHWMFDLKDAKGVSNTFAADELFSAVPTEIEWSVFALGAK